MSRWSHFEIVLAVSIFASAFSATALRAATIPINSSGGLYNTGVDASGTVLTYGSTDPHYVIHSGPSISVGSDLAEKTMDSSGGFPIGPWLGDNTTSRWISQSTDNHGGEGSGTFDNLTTFTSPIAGPITITGQWATDDSGSDILLNGVSTGNTAGGFSSYFSFTINGTALAGTNTLEFLQGQGGTPGGVRVEFTSASVTPEPSSIALLGLGGIAALSRRRKPAR